jgi:hypothetical protein
MPHHLPNHPGATLLRTTADGARIWRQRPLDFSGHRTVAEVDGDVSQFHAATANGKAVHYHA